MWMTGRRDSRHLKIRLRRTQNADGLWLHVGLVVRIMEQRIRKPCEEMRTARVTNGSARSLCLPSWAAAPFSGNRSIGFSPFVLSYDPPTCLSTHPSTHSPTQTFIRPPTHLFLYSSSHASTCPPAHSFVHPSSRLSTDPTIYPFNHPVIQSPMFLSIHPSI